MIPEILLYSYYFMRPTYKQQKIIVKPQTLNIILTSLKMLQIKSKTETKCSVSVFDLINFKLVTQLRKPQTYQ